MKSLKNNVPTEVIDWLKSHKRILLVTHQGADEDGLGAMFGMYHSLTGEEYKVIPYTNTPINKSIQSIPGVHIRKVGKIYAKFDGIISFDIGSPNRIDLPENLGEIGQYDWLNIDHHPQETPSYGLHWIDTNVSSTCEMVTRLLSEDFSIAQHGATSLISGMISDTYHLHHALHPNTYNTLGELIRRGGDIDGVVTKVMHAQNKDAIHIWGNVLGAMQWYEKVQFLQAFLDNKDLKTTKTPYEQLGFGRLTNLLGHLKDPQIIGFAREFEPNTWKGSFRSTPRSKVPARKAAGVFGGGGHEQASGFKFDGTKNEYTSRLKQLFQI